MKYQKSMRFTVLLLYTLLITSLNSCSEITGSKKLEKDKIERTTNCINKNKDEAKLLLMLSQDNQDAILISKTLQTTTEKTIVNLAKKIEENHLDIARAYHEVASNKLISIPSYSELEYNHFSSQHINNNKTIQELITVIARQRTLLVKLAKITDKKEFKTLVAKANIKLSESLNSTQNLINSIKANS